MRMTHQAITIQEQHARPAEELYRLASNRSDDGSTASSWAAVRVMSLEEYARLEDYTEQLIAPPGRGRETRSLKDKGL